MDGRCTLHSHVRLVLLVVIVILPLCQVFFVLWWKVAQSRLFVLAPMFHLFSIDNGFQNLRRVAAGKGERGAGAVILACTEVFLRRWHAEVALDCTVSLRGIALGPRLLKARGQE